MSMSGMNDKRADWADKAINTFIDTTQTEPEDAVSDLLCDMMHWCDLHSEYDFGDQLDRAISHYEAEIIEEFDEAVEEYGR